MEELIQGAVRELGRRVGRTSVHRTELESQETLAKLQQYEDQIRTLIFL